MSFQPIYPLLKARRRSRPTCRSWPAASWRARRPASPWARWPSSGAGRSSRAGSTASAAVGMSAPVYWVGAMTVVFFHPQVGEIARLPISRPNTYKPLTTDPLAWLQSLWLPWIILGLPLAAITMRMMRASLHDTFDEDFVRTARGKGLTAGPGDAPPLDLSRQPHRHLARRRDDGDGDRRRHPARVHLQHPEQCSAWWSRRWAPPTCRPSRAWPSPERCWWCWPTWRPTSCTRG